jgi:hypothetical protein
MLLLIKTTAMISNRQSYLLLAIGAILMLFSNGRWIISYATWLSPIFFLRIMRLQKSLKGFLLVALAMAIVNIVIWWKIIPAPPGVYFLTTALMMQVFALCFLADRSVCGMFENKWFA